MRWFKADLHVHTVLSPCGGLDMSPVNIIRQAVQEKIDILAITDHNSMKHCASAVEIGKKYGITVLPGTEVNTREEIHCLALFENLMQAEVFQHYLEERMTPIPNRPDFFGPQYVVDEAENVVDEEENLLLAALDSSIEEVEAEVHRLGGLFIPAHINRMQNGIYSQLGFLPGGLQADALEIALTADASGFLRDHPETETFPLITGSDAHALEQLGAHYTELYMEHAGFREIRDLVSEKMFQSIRIR